MTTCSILRADSLMFPEYPIDISNNTQLRFLYLVLDINSVDSDTGCIVQFVSQLKSNVKCKCSVVFVLSPPTLRSTDYEEIKSILTRLCHGFCSQLDQILIPRGLDNLPWFSFNLSLQEKPGVRVRKLWDQLVRSQMPTLNKRGIIGCVCLLR